MQSFDITVHYSAGAYVTRVVNGHRASCTIGAQQAAARLGQKLFPESFVDVQPLAGQPVDGAQTTRWRLLASTEG